MAVRLEADPEGPPAGATFVLFEVVSGLEYLVPAEVAIEGDEVVLTGGFDPGDVALGAPLPEGEWLVGLELAARTGSVRVQLPNQPLVPAIIHGRPVVRTFARPRLALQVGRVRRNFITAEPGDARITESAAGTRLELPLRRLHLAGTSDATGSIVLGRLPVRADIHVHDGTPRLEAWLSGLPGSYRLGIRFGEGRATQTGLVLKVDGEGRMRLVRAASGPRRRRRRPASGPHWYIACVAPYRTRWRGRWAGAAIARSAATGPDYWARHWADYWAPTKSRPRLSRTAVAS